MKRQDKTTLNQIADYWIKNNNIDETQLNFVNSTYENYLKIMQKLQN